MQPFIVKLTDLHTGKNEISWTASQKFFESFGNTDIIGADITAHSFIVNRGATVFVSCAITGSVTVPCDRCLENLEISLETSFEETYVPDGEDLDLSQDVYDYVCTALPLQRVHEDGGCNSETIKYLSK